MGNYKTYNRAGLQIMTDERGMPTLRLDDSGDELDERDVAPCGSVMEGTSSTFIFLIQDLRALLHQGLEESQVTPLSQLVGQHIKLYNKDTDFW